MHETHLQDNNYVSHWKYFSNVNKQTKSLSKVLLLESIERERSTYEVKRKEHHEQSLKL